MKSIIRKCFIFFDQSNFRIIIIVVVIVIIIIII